MGRYSVHVVGIQRPVLLKGEGGCLKLKWAD